MKSTALSEGCSFIRAEYFLSTYFFKTVGKFFGCNCSGLCTNDFCVMCNCSLLHQSSSSGKHNILIAEITGCTITSILFACKSFIFFKIVFQSDPGRIYSCFLPTASKLTIQTTFSNLLRLSIKFSLRIIPLVVK